MLRTTLEPSRLPNPRASLDDKSRIFRAIWAGFAGFAGFEGKKGRLAHLKPQFWFYFCFLQAASARPACALTALASMNSRSPKRLR